MTRAQWRHDEKMADMEPSHHTGKAENSGKKHAYITSVMSDLDIQWSHRVWECLKFCPVCWIRLGCLWDVSGSRRCREVCHVWRCLTFDRSQSTQGRDLEGRFHRQAKDVYIAFSLSQHYVTLLADLLLFCLLFWSLVLLDSQVQIIIMRFINMTALHDYAQSWFDLL